VGPVGPQGEQGLEGPAGPQGEVGPAPDMTEFLQSVEFRDAVQAIIDAQPQP
jgi:hypothetical protein